MSPTPELIVDTVFFGFAILVMSFTAVRPERVFRILALGHFDHMTPDRKPTPGQMKVVQFLAGFCAINGSFYLVLRWLGFM